MNGSGKSRIDEAWERGYACGLRDGLNDRPKLANWNLPETKPNEDEVVCAVVEPYDRKTERRCRKMGVSWFAITGVFMGRDTVRKISGIGAEVPSEEIPDLLFISKREAVDWGYVRLWLSEEVPEWFLERERKGENG